MAKPARHADSSAPGCHALLLRVLELHGYPQVPPARIVSLNHEDSLDGKMEPLDKTHAVYCGSFDPLTLGHLDIVTRGAKLFGSLTIGVGINPDKRAFFEPERRVELISNVVADFDNVNVKSFDGLTVDFVRSLNAGVLLRGVRSLSDTESEFTMSMANSVLAPDVETVFLVAKEGLSHISSTLIKQVASMSRDDTARKLEAFLPASIIKPVLTQVAAIRAAG